jgi:hypothetical protein
MISVTQSQNPPAPYCPLYSTVNSDELGKCKCYGNSTDNSGTCGFGGMCFVVEVKTEVITQQ